MHQQLMVQPFISDIHSKEYNECYVMAHRDITNEHTAELVESRIAAARSSFTSNHDNCYHPYLLLSSTAYNGYRTDAGHNLNTSNHSFRNKEGQFAGPRLCLRCRSKESHILTNCDAKLIHNHPECKTNVSIKDKHLVYNSDGAAVCIKFNLQGSCTADPTRHPPHRCSLCLVSYLRAMQCSHI
jgi:hypothetical protein